ncbi:Unannotated [Lentimonas sp. CC4]|nr:Unannotated [Lentimonas sp. CC4]CAA6686209.1 Unannotated [Lentimonas sp. CC6]CAA7074239.1 Unannotated [Lentimonas sp. CC4]
MYKDMQGKGRWSREVRRGSLKNLLMLRETLHSSAKATAACRLGGRGTFP